jgi:hypothetical protein
MEEELHFYFYFFGHTNRNRGIRFGSKGNWNDNPEMERSYIPVLQSVHIMFSL